MFAGSEERASSSHHHAGDQAAEVMGISSPEGVSVNSTTIYMIILTCESENRTFLVSVFRGNDM